MVHDKVLSVLRGGGADENVHFFDRKYSLSDACCGSAHDDTLCVMAVHSMQGQ